MRRLSLPIFAPLLVISSAPALALPGFEAGVRWTYWFPDLSATAQTTTAGVPETKFDVKGDLGVGDEDFFSGEACVRFGRGPLRLAQTPLPVSGYNTPTPHREP